MERGTGAASILGPHSASAARTVSALAAEDSSVGQAGRVPELFVAELDADGIALVITAAENCHLREGKIEVEILCSVLVFHCYVIKLP